MYWYNHQALSHKFGFILSTLLSQITHTKPCKGQILGWAQGAC